MPDMSPREEDIVDLFGSETEPGKLYDPTTGDVYRLERPAGLPEPEGEEMPHRRFRRSSVIGRSYGADVVLRDPETDEPYDATVLAADRRDAHHPASFSR